MYLIIEFSLLFIVFWIIYRLPIDIAEKRGLNTEDKWLIKNLTWMGLLLEIPWIVALCKAIFLNQIESLV